jgi:Ni,Fe-hydrogenase I cytochrome b subunit
MSEIPAPTEVELNDLYHRPQRMIRVANWANTLSWVVLIVVGLFLVFFVSAIYVTITQSSTNLFIELIPTLVQAFLILIPGLFLFVILQAVSESIYLLMDIEENTRNK